MEEKELREQVIGLSEMVEIKQKRKYLENCPVEMLKVILKKYENEKLKEVNELATKAILGQTSSVLCWLRIAREKFKTDLESNLGINKILRKDIEKVVGMVTFCWFRHRRTYRWEVRRQKLLRRRRAKYE